MSTKGKELLADVKSKAKANAPVKARRTVEVRSIFIVLGILAVFGLGGYLGAYLMHGHDVSMAIHDANIVAAQSK